MQILTVLKSGGDYDVQHVEKLRDQCAKHAPDAEFICLTDLHPDCKTIPLKYNWGGWWSKMELFRPDIKGDFLFMDLDTVVFDDITPLFTGRLTILRDFYRKYGLQSSLMFLPESDRSRVWEDWITCPDDFMRVHRAGGDQTFLERHYMDALRWQTLMPGSVVSFKVHCMGGAIPEGVAVIIFHGKPRPWDIPHRWAGWRE